MTVTTMFYTPVINPLVRPDYTDGAAVISNKHIEFQSVDMCRGDFQVGDGSPELGHRRRSDRRRVRVAQRQESSEFSVDESRQTADGHQLLIVKSRSRMLLLHPWTVLSHRGIYIYIPLRITAWTFNQNKSSLL